MSLPWQQLAQDEDASHSASQDLSEDEAPAPRPSKRARLAPAPPSSSSSSSSASMPSAETIELLRKEGASWLPSEQAGEHAPASALRALEVPPPPCPGPEGEERDEEKGATGRDSRGCD